MNVSTQQEQTPLHEHYNRANQLFQTGQLQQALAELEQARQYAANENQAAHIDKSIKTVREMMQQQEPEPAVNESYVEEEAPSESNKMVLLTILVGLICLTPIVMKLITIFSQPSPPPAQDKVTASAPATAGDDSATTANNANAEPAPPSSTPDVIINTDVNETQAVATAATATLNASGVNLRDQPSTSSNTVTHLDLNQTVSVVNAAPVQADGYAWSKIETASGQSGWVASKFLQTATPAAQANPPANAAADSTTTPASAPAENAAGTRLVNASGVALRSEPGTGKPLVTTLTQARVTVLEDKAVTTDGFVWSKVRTANGSEGWLADKFLSN